MEKVRFRLKEAIANAQDKGISVSRTELAEQLWPGRSVDTRRSNLCNLERGKTTRVDASWVWILTKELDCTADMLFGIAPFPNTRVEDSK